MSREAPNQLLQAVGLRLTATRLALSLTQEAMARAIGVERNAYANWEGGTRLAQVPAMLRLMQRFGISLDWIYAGQLRSVPFEVAQQLVAQATALGAPVDVPGGLQEGQEPAPAAPPGRIARRPRRLSLHAPPPRFRHEE